jgi:hypothetical protein
MKAFLETDGKDLLLCSASRYFSTSTFGGSCNVTTLKCKSVWAGHDALMIDAAVCSSAAERGASGCDGTDFAVRGVASVEISVDIFPKLLQNTEATFNARVQSSKSFKPRFCLIAPP